MRRSCKKPLGSLLGNKLATAEGLGVRVGEEDDEALALELVVDDDVDV